MCSLTNRRWVIQIIHHHLKASEFESRLSSFFIFAEETLYTYSADQSLKVWDLRKLGLRTPKFNNGKDKVEYIRTDQVLPPERNLAISVYTKIKEYDESNVLLAY